jgi:hypothetical protein
MRNNLLTSALRALLLENGRLQRDAIDLGRAVTARDGEGAPCLSGVGGAAAGSPAACMYNVDLTNVGPAPEFR